AQPPDHDDVEFAAAGRLQQPLTTGPLLRTRADVPDLPREGPAPGLDINPHPLDLEAERLLVLRGKPGLKRRREWPAPPRQKPPAGAAAPDPLFHRAFGAPARGWPFLSFSAGWVRRLRGFPAVGQQLLDPAVRVRAHPPEHVAKIREGVDAPGLARRAQAHQH